MIPLLCFGVVGFVVLGVFPPEREFLLVLILLSVLIMLSFQETFVLSEMRLQRL